VLLHTTFILVALRNGLGFMGSGGRAVTPAAQLLDAALSWMTHLPFGIGKLSTSFILGIEVLVIQPWGDE